MNTKHNTYLDLSKLSDRERIIVRNILHEKREYVPFFTDLFEIERHYKLHFDKGDWLCGDSWFGEKTEISFPEWKSMMNGTSAKNTNCCEKCGGRLALISGNFYFEADAEPYESGIEEDVVFEKNKEQINGFICDDCQTVQKLWSE